MTTRLSQLTAGTRPKRDVAAGQTLPRGARRSRWFLVSTRPVRHGLLTLGLLTLLFGTCQHGWAQAGQTPTATDTVSPSDQLTVDSPKSDEAKPDAEADDSAATVSSQTMFISSLTIFVLAIFVGFEVITKVPPTLHTPLMSGSNAISGITIVGAIIVTGQAGGFSASSLGFFAVIFATINVVGGFLVTHRMLAMFKKR